MKDINKEVQEAEEKLAKLKKEQERVNNLPENKRLAEWMHDNFCGHNHTDHCGWGYELNWEGSAHRSYLTRANAILNLVDYNTAVKVIEAYNKWY